MKASIVMMKTGETLIANLQEVFKGEGEDKRGICLLLNHPYTLDFHSPKKKEKVQLKDNEVQVQFVKWCPFSKDVQFKIPYDSVVTIGEPEDTLREAFERKVELAEEKMKVDEVKKEYASDVTVVGAGVR